MQKVTVLGAGKIGAAVVKMLHHSGSYELTVADTDVQALARLSEAIGIKTVPLDVSDEAKLYSLIQADQVVISACSFDLNTRIAMVCLKVGASYFDLTEDVATTRSILDIAAKAKEGQIFMPQYGLAPGFIDVLGFDISRNFDKVESLKMRVGALPQYPSNQMMYNLTWSTDGLINEYCNPCEVIRDGEYLEVLPLEGLEHFSLDGMEYEAFNTSGGLGTLCTTLKGKVELMNYKTVRYKGHQYLMSFLINDLNLGQGSRRNLLKEIMESSVPITKQDVVLIFVTCSGWREGKLEQISDARKIYHADMFGEEWSSIQITTSAGVCTAVDLYFQGKLPQRGFVRQEDMPLADFLTNQFGRCYETASNVSGAIASTPTT
ncbi:MAG: saccharopine dehydrogenase C-terminal domain-containing protein [Pseudomonadales bacterium]|jgi:saccharopine dehydrogenase-like NADP-dependent oxidoreductase|nr:saccharopine dehydrogenase C-terminal domain-containing protein [Pseudomonadales bacterium]MDP7358008.1 saccharopine dehydrogenase C-terminal domain-containing protein [Pseudomonadales bacterium]MDP7594108.1 saccharopine dehydrogenase C-terminal domain-containing protein [Pseudomonadales bacterium]